MMMAASVGIFPSKLESSLPREWKDCRFLWLVEWVHLPLIIVSPLKILSHWRKDDKRNEPREFSLLTYLTSISPSRIFFHFILSGNPLSGSFFKLIFIFYFVDLLNLMKMFKIYETLFIETSEIIGSYRWYSWYKMCVIAGGHPEGDSFQIYGLIRRTLIPRFKVTDRICFAFGRFKHMGFVCPRSPKNSFKGDRTSQVELEFGNVGFCAGKEENRSIWRKPLKPTTNSTHTRPH